MEEQLDIFAFEEHSSEINRETTRKTGFEYRKRIYDSDGNYMYMKIQSETGVRLTAMSIMITSLEILVMSDRDYKQWLKTNDYKEVEPKEVKNKLKGAMN